MQTPIFAWLLQIKADGSPPLHCTHAAIFPPSSDLARNLFDLPDCISTAMRMHRRGSGADAAALQQVLQVLVQVLAEMAFMHHEVAHSFMPRV